MLELDLRGLLCPLPVLKLRKALKEIEIGASVRLVASDPASKIDVPHFCNEQGHVLISSEEEQDIYTFVVRCGNQTTC